MTANHKTLGKCVFCNKFFNRTGMFRHLISCSKRKKHSAETNSISAQLKEIYYLLIQDAYDKNYWLHLEMAGSTKLEELDNYLRYIWLECCGHMSQFSFGRWKDEISMTSKIKKVFEPGVEIFHMYDFGYTSETLIKCVSVREGNISTGKPVFLMARNNLPEDFCKECGAKANWFCIECALDCETAVLCDKHAEIHPHEDYGEPIEIVNSPRLGMCGYNGPAEPPY